MGRMGEPKPVFTSILKGLLWFTREFGPERGEGPADGEEPEAVSFPSREGGMTGFIGGGTDILNGLPLSSPEFGSPGHTKLSIDGGCVPAMLLFTGLFCMIHERYSRLQPRKKKVNNEQRRRKEERGGGQTAASFTAEGRVGLHLSDNCT